MGSTTKSELGEIERQKTRPAAARGGRAVLFDGQADKVRKITRRTLGESGCAGGGRGCW